MKTWQDKKEFKNKVLTVAKQLNIKVKSISLRQMKKKWASCSTAGNLNFNSELLEMEKKLGEYVIVHELLHFQVPNHGKLWKSLMRAYLGKYEKIERRLKTKVKD
ncbi:MAG: M48 family metallopeptidase [Melioribacteraceae bacterium]